MYYHRGLSPEFFSLLKVGGPLGPLVDLTQEKWRDKDLHPDLQLRSNTISLYIGLTKVLQIRMDKKRSLHPSSAGAYGLRDHGVRMVYKPDERSSLITDVRRYLDRVDVDDRYLTDEGRCQNWLSYHYGSKRRPGNAEPLAIDREAVIGYTDTAEKNLLWDQPIRQQARLLTESISRANPELYGTNLHQRPLGNELDMLMWKPPGVFLVTEVKGGKNAHGIYMAPVQVAAYTMVWKHFARVDPLGGIKCLVEQKRKLGLVAMDDAEWDQFTASLVAPQFVPALIVQKPNRASTCWKRLGEVIEQVSAAWPESWESPIMDSLEIYTIETPGGDLEDHTEDWRDW